MNQYIATFYSHFGAVRFARDCEARGWQTQLRPVPRTLSSSCGTCVYFTADALPAMDELRTPELEQLVQQDEGYRVIYTSD